MAVARPITILSVEDHPVSREGLGTIIGSQTDMPLVAQAANSEEATEEYDRHQYGRNITPRNLTDRLILSEWSCHAKQTHSGNSQLGTLVADPSASQAATR